MSVYHIKVIKGSSEKIYPCDGYTVTSLPESGYYREHPEIIGLPLEGYYSEYPDKKKNGPPEGQILKLILEPELQEIYLPKHGREIFIMNEKGDTIDRYPKKRRKGMRMTEGKEG